MSTQVIKEDLKDESKEAQATLPAETKKGKIRAFFSDLALPQIIAGSLSAITVAFLLSQLGLGGTLVGAGTGSIVGALGTTLYQKSITSSARAIKNGIARKAGESDEDYARRILETVEESGEETDGGEELPEDTYALQESPSEGFTLPQGNVSWPRMAVLAAILFAITLSALSFVNSQMNGTGTDMSAPVIINNEEAPLAASGGDAPGEPEIVYVIQESEVDLEGYPTADEVANIVYGILSTQEDENDSEETQIPAPAEGEQPLSEEDIETILEALIADEVSRRVAESEADLRETIRQEIRESTERQSQPEIPTEDQETPVSDSNDENQDQETTESESTRQSANEEE